MTHPARGTVAGGYRRLSMSEWHRGDRREVRSGASPDPATTPWGAPQPWQSRDSPAKDMLQYGHATPNGDRDSSTG